MYLMKYLVYSKC